MWLHYIINPEQHTTMSPKNRSARNSGSNPLQNSVGFLINQKILCMFLNIIIRRNGNFVIKRQYSGLIILLSPILYLQFKIFLVHSFLVLKENA